MKSAYELAMERLQKASPSLALNEDQKKELAEIDSVYRAKIAEKELFLKNQIRSAQNAGKSEEDSAITAGLRSKERKAARQLFQVIVEDLAAASALLFDSPQVLKVANAVSARLR